MTGMSPYTFLPLSPPVASTNKIFNEKNYNNPSGPIATPFNQNVYATFTTDVINNSGANTYYNVSSGVTVTNISEKTRTYANDFITSDKAVTDTYYYGLLSGSITYDGTGEELIRRLQSNINNTENKIKNDYSLSTEDKNYLLATTAATKSLLPTIVSFANQVATCSEQQYNTIQTQGFGRFFKKLCNITATLIACTIQGTIYGAVYGAFLGAAAFGPGIATGILWGATAGAVTGLFSGIDRIAKGRCVWGPC